MKKTYLPIATLSVMVTLAGCTGDAGGGDNPSTPTPAVATKSAGPSGGKEGEVGAINAVADFTCAKDKNGDWNAAWTVKNESKEKHTYRVVVNVTNAQHQVLKTKEVVGDVNAGESKKMSAPKVFPKAEAAKQKSVLCFPAAYSK